MNQHRVRKDLIEAIRKMEEAGDWPIVQLLLELANFRLQKSIKTEVHAIAEKKVAA